MADAQRPIFGVRTCDGTWAEVRASRVLYRDGRPIADVPAGIRLANLDHLRSWVLATCSAPAVEEVAPCR